ncbi:MAG: hypothetical protein AAGG11_08690 [Pseudomonadota bacterium]
MRMVSVVLLVLASLSSGEGIAQTKYIVNKAGDLLHEGDGFSVYKLAHENPLHKHKRNWCSAAKFAVSAAFDRDASFVFTPDDLYTTLFDGLLLELRQQHCPEASQTVSATVYLRDVFFNAQGVINTREDAVRDGRYKNAAIVDISFHNDFAASPKGRPASAENLKFLYVESGRLRAQRSAADVAKVVGSVELLQAYWARGRMTMEEYSALHQQHTAAQTLYAQVHERYGLDFKNTGIFLLLAGKAEDLSWSSVDEWNFLRDYVLALSPLCGERTAGAPFKNSTTYVDDQGEEARESEFVLWYSAELAPRVRGMRIGTLYGGVHEPDGAIAEDLASLVEAHGCGSEPFAVIEAYFH